MIRLKGREALLYAYYAVLSRESGPGPSPRFFAEGDEGGVLEPEEVLAGIGHGRIKRESLLCDLPSVWDLLLEAEAEASLVMHPSRNTVLVFTSSHGADLGEGVRGFAIHAEVFEHASMRAMQTPVENRDYDYGGFLISLYPPMLLERGRWEKDLELLRHSIEIALELMALFGLDPQRVWKEFSGDSPEGGFTEEDVVHGGMLLDRVLERIGENPVGLSGLGAASRKRASLPGCFSGTALEKETR